MLKIRFFHPRLQGVLIGFVLGWLLTACTPHFVLEGIRADLQAHVSPPAVDRGGYRDLKGAIHVHSHISHDSEGRAEDLIRAGQAAGLDYIILTDHETPQIFTRGLQGWHGGILFVRGMEINKHCPGDATQCDSLLAIGIQEYFDHRPLSFQAVIDRVNRQGGLAIVAHPQGWQDWARDGVTGLEIYDILDDTLDRKWKLPKFLLDILYSYRDYPDEVFLGIQDRPAWHLQKWDALTRHGRWVGIAGNDAHQNVRVWGRQLDPYHRVFRYVSTHLLVTAPGETALLEALRSGHAYVAFDLLAPAHGFWFSLAGHETQEIMGDVSTFRHGLSLHVQTPAAGRILLIKDGNVVKRCDCAMLDFRVSSPGVYRVEVLLNIHGRWRPWIFSNPIYLREPA